MSTSAYLLIDFEDPGLDVLVVLVGDVLYGEDRAVLLGTGALRPEVGEAL